MHRENFTFYIKVKEKMSLYLTKHHTMKTYWGSGGIAQRILNVGTRWRWVVSFTPWPPLCPWGKEPPIPISRRLGGLQIQSGHSELQKNPRGPLSLLSNGYSFPGGKAAGVVKLTTHLHLEPRSRMRGAIPPLPNMPSWSGAQLKHRGNFTLLFTFSPVTAASPFT
jgi:hypothetical protein